MFFLFFLVNLVVFAQSPPDRENIVAKEINRTMEEQAKRAKPKNKIQFDDHCRSFGGKPVIEYGSIKDCVDLPVSGLNANLLNQYQATVSRRDTERKKSKAVHDDLLQKHLTFKAQCASPGSKIELSLDCKKKYQELELVRKKSNKDSTRISAELEKLRNQPENVAASKELHERFLKKMQECQNMNLMSIEKDVCEREMMLLRDAQGDVNKRLEKQVGLDQIVSRDDLYNLEQKIRSSCPKHVKSYTADCQRMQSEIRKHNSVSNNNIKDYNENVIEICSKSGGEWKANISNVSKYKCSFIARPGRRTADMVPGCDCGDGHCTYQAQCIKNPKWHNQCALDIYGKTDTCLY